MVFTMEKLMQPHDSLVPHLLACLSIILLHAQIFDNVFSIVSN